MSETEINLEVQSNENSIVIGFTDQTAVFDKLSKDPDTFVKEIPEVW